jgi:hypothetical protein
MAFVQPILGLKCKMCETDVSQAGWQAVTLETSGSQPFLPPAPFSPYVRTSFPPFSRLTQKVCSK